MVSLREIRIEQEKVWKEGTRRISLLELSQWILLKFCFQPDHAHLRKNPTVCRVRLEFCIFESWLLTSSPVLYPPAPLQGAPSSSCGPLPPLSCLWVLSLGAHLKPHHPSTTFLENPPNGLVPWAALYDTTHFFLCVYVLPSLLEVGTSDMMGVVVCSWGTWMWLAEGKRSTSRPWALQAAECLFATWDQTRDLAFGLGTLILHVDPQGSASQLLPGLLVGLGYGLCLQRENLQMSFLSGSAGHPDLTWGHSLHSACPPLPRFLKYGEQSGEPSSESGDLRHLGHQVLLPGGGSAAPTGWPAPWPGCCGGPLPRFFSLPSTGIVRHLSFLILLYGALEI